MVHPLLQAVLRTGRLMSQHSPPIPDSGSFLVD